MAHLTYCGEFHTANSTHRIGHNISDNNLLVFVVTLYQMKSHIGKVLSQTVYKSKTMIIQRKKV